MLVSVLCASCDSGVLWKDKPYEVSWIDVGSNRALVYSLGNGSSIGRVEAEVIAVGSNTFYVVAKQRKKSTNAISYFYIERKIDNKYNNWDEITKGPYSKKEYDEKRYKLSLPEFTVVFE